MTKSVVTASPDSKIDDIAALMLKNHISAVPVLDDAGKIVGLVSEGDLMRRVEGAAKERRSWWLWMLTSPSNELQEWVTLHGRFARDVMTRD
ncbi:MAG: CBS domain-containing protein, partial [Paracoccaceae bacterium]